MVKILILVLSFSLLFVSHVHADSVYLKDGKIVRGTITEEDDTTLLLETNDTWQKIERSTIEFIRKDDRQRKEPSVMTPRDDKEVSAAPEKNRSGIGKKEAILKIAADVAGRHAFSNVEVVGTNTVDRGSATIGTGISLTAEGIYYVRPTIGIGAGISFQTPRPGPDSHGHFSFIPLYGLVRVRSTPTSDNRYLFTTAHFGYNYFRADRDYVGAGTYQVTNGAYAGFGAGYVFGRMQVEALYTVDRGRLSGNDYDSVNAQFYSVSAYATYSKISLSLGVLF